MRSWKSCRPFSSVPGPVGNPSETSAAQGAVDGPDSTTFAMRLFVVLALVVGWSAGAVAQPSARGLETTISTILADTSLADGFWGIHVVDLESGAELFSMNAGHNYIPASNMKVLTTAAVLDALGPDYRYTTRLYASGDIRGSTLDGHLVIRGTGDPTISDRRFTTHYPTDGDAFEVFRQWSDSLKAQGITSVTGHVIGDASYFDDELLGAGWAWDDEPTPFAAQISALSFNEGRLSISATGTSLGSRARVRVEPDNDFVYVVNRSQTVASGARHQIRRDQGGNTIWFESEVPRGQTVSRTVSVHNPTRYFVHSLRALLRDEGITVSGDPVIGEDWWQGLDYGQMRSIATHTSPPMSELISVTNKVSQNLYAEHLLRTLGAERCATARRRATERRRDPDRVRCGSSEAGILASEPLFERAGMRVDRMRLRDGSGMSPYNMLSPLDLTALLQYMWNHPDASIRQAFVESMAIGGVDGTLRRRFSQSPANGSVFAKTGTVTGARNLAGYATTASGRPVAFAVLTNLFGTSTGRVTRAQDEIVEAIVRHVR